MFAQFLFSLFVACVYSTSVESGTDIEKIYPPSKQCFESLTKCLARRLCYNRVKDLEIGCCKKSFVNGNYDEEKEEECMMKRIEDDVEDCMTDAGEDCALPLAFYLTQKEEKFKAIEKSIKNAVGLPQNEGSCERYLDEMEEEEWNVCSENTDEDFEWACDLMYEIMKDSPLANRKCFEDFSDCIVTAVSERAAEKMSISCCRESIGNRSHYYEVKQKCMEKEMKPIFMGCLTTSNKYCTPKLISNYIENKDAFEDFKKQISTIGAPKSELKCRFNFIEEKKMALDICKMNTNEGLDSFCSIIQRIFQTELQQDYNDNAYERNENGALY